VGLKIEIHEIHQNLRNPISLIGPIVSETCWNQWRQPPTLSGRRTWTVDEIEVASSL